MPANLAAAGGVPIDRVDFKILKILRRDARTPFVEVARQVGMTEGAIRARVKRMTDDGTIERFTVSALSGVNPSAKVKAGGSLAEFALIEASTSCGRLRPSWLSEP